MRNQIRPSKIRRVKLRMQILFYRLRKNKTRVLPRLITIGVSFIIRQKLNYYIFCIMSEYSKVRNNQQKILLFVTIQELTIRFRILQIFELILLISVLFTIKKQMKLNSGS